MKGRLYDATIGRFISADPQVQFTYDLQSFNRYIYTHNNPLKFVDPSGYGFFKKLFKKLKKAFKKVGKLIKKVVKKVVKFVKKYWRAILAVAIVYFTAGAATQWAAGLLGGAQSATIAFYAAEIGTVIGAAISGGLAGFVTTGTLKGAFIGALSGAAFAGIGNAFAGQGGVGKWINKFSKGVRRGLRVASHGVVGGLRSVASGGKFKEGFFAAGFTAYSSDTIGLINSDSGRIVAAGVVGGIGSRIGGGSFEDGFVTGAFSRGFNDCLHGGCSGLEKKGANNLFVRDSNNYFDEGGNHYVTDDFGRVRLVGSDLPLLPAPVDLFFIPGSLGVKWFLGLSRVKQIRVVVETVRALNVGETSRPPNTGLIPQPKQPTPIVRPK